MGGHIWAEQPEPLEPKTLQALGYKGQEEAKELKPLQLHQVWKSLGGSATKQLAFTGQAMTVCVNCLTRPCRSSLLFSMRLKRKPRLQIGGQLH